MSGRMLIIGWHPQATQEHDIFLSLREGCNNLPGIAMVKYNESFRCAYLMGAVLADILFLFLQSSCVIEVLFFSERLLYVDSWYDHEK